MFYPLNYESASLIITCPTLEEHGFALSALLVILFSITRKNFLGEVLFWLHVGFIAGMAVSGLFLHLYWLIVIAAIWKLHTVVFRGCLLTNTQKRLGLHDPNKTFVQGMILRLTGRQVSEKQAGRVLISVFVFAFASAIITDLLGWKLT